MEAFSSVDVLAVASVVLSQPAGEIVEQVDHDQLDALMAEVNHVVDSDLSLAGGVLMHGLVSLRLFGRSDAQVALAATLQLLAVNGHDLELEPPGIVLALVEGVRSGALEPRALAACLASRLRTLPNANDDVEVPEGMRERIRLVEAATLERFARSRGAHRYQGLPVGIEALVEHQEAALEENARLRALLRKRGIDPDAPSASSGTGSGTG